MYKFSEAVLRHRKVILAVMLVAAVVSVFLLTQVTVNYDLAGYLPDSMPTRQAMKQLSGDMPNLDVYVPDTSPEQALAVKEQLSQMPGVSLVLWLDDMVDLRATPFDMVPAKAKDGYYAHGGPLYQVTVDDTDVVGSINAIREAFPGALLRGDAANQAQTRGVSMGEIASIMYYLVPLVLLILIWATRHWIEPVLFMLVIGIAILLNEGTNIFIGEVSFITRACSAALQMAVSIDYAVFLLHRFAENREQGMEPWDAMRLAMQQSASAIAASAMTTVFGFLALLAMEFGMGYDMGIVLAKGVLLSYFAVMVVLPAAAISATKWIDKTAHRSLMPSFDGLGRFVVRWFTIPAILIILALPVAYMGQTQNDFVYGSEGMHAENSDIIKEAREVERLFGRSQPMMLLVPQGEPARSAQLAHDLQSLPYVRRVISFATEAGVQMPSQMLPDTARQQLFDGPWERLVVTADLPQEGDLAFGAVEEVRAMADKAFDGNYHLLSESAVNYDLKDVITGDSLKVLLVGVAAIGIILLLTFKNVAIPLILLLVIEGSIWLNMATPYFMGQTMNYMGYQIISSLQLGATVDYGILLSQRYLEGRKTLDKREAARFAIRTAGPSITPPALILTIAGYSLKFAVTSNGVISQMGEIIGRGAAISLVMVLLVLPLILVWCDGLIQKTMLKKRERTAP